MTDYRSVPKKYRRFLCFFLLFLVLAAELYCEQNSLSVTSGSSESAPLQTRTYQNRMLYAVHHDVLPDRIQARKLTATLKAAKDSVFCVERHTRRFLFFLHTLALPALALAAYCQDLRSSGSLVPAASSIIRYIHDQDGEKDKALSYY